MGWGALAMSAPLRSRRVAGADGVGLHVVEAGPEEAPAFLLIHGWSQHHLCWSKQLSGALAERYRVVAFDLRGHGASDKPLTPEAYESSEPWAGDLAAILEALGLERPILVGWSMGAWALMDYLRVHGDARLGGVAITGAGPRAGAALDPEIAARRGPAVRADATYGADQGAALRAAIAFVKACAAAPLSKTDLALMVGYMTLCPPEVRRAARLRDLDYRDDLARLRAPALLIQGGAERVCLKPMFEEMRAALPAAQAIVYPGAGHLPFWEEPARFDADLAAFAEQVWGGAR